MVLLYALNSNVYVVLGNSKTQKVGNRTLS
jgi:hypothetical protein